MRHSFVLGMFCSAVCLFSFSPLFAQKPRITLKAYSTVKAARDAKGNIVAPADSVSSLARFTYTVTSTRDGNSYTGVMVGQDPFAGNFVPTSVTTPIVPVIVHTNSIAIKLSAGGILATTKGATIFDPTVPDNSCLTSPHNVPLALAQESPIFQAANFKFGHTFVGKTQYIDAFQRGNFWEFTNGTNYHTVLNPVLLPPVTLNIAANDALAIPPGLFGSCGALGIVNISTMDSILTGTLLPALAAQGVDTSAFPIFLFYNVVMSVGQANNLNDCCVLGFHGATGTPIQTFSPLDFDTTGLFGPNVADTSIMAHEVGEWMDDPFGNNPTPAWGHTGQVAGCQNNLEVGDPLSGTNVASVRGANGFTYHLQELAFFSWFYGAPSIAVNQWFSDNNTFTTDAGPPCQ